MLDTILDSPLSSWLQLDTDATDHIVISSRIRLARNFDGILFTNRNDMSSLEKVNTISRGLLKPLKEADGHQYSNINLEQLSERERAILVEKHLMSPALEEKLPYRNLVVSDDASIVIMVNEEDHLRIQSMVSGLRLEEAYERILKIDKTIEDKYPYAFDERFGYLTACPTNVGTGLRASVMLHLPALTISGKITRLIRSIIQLGYSVRGLYGEGSEALGNIYQISNQRTMGTSEEDTIEQLTKIVEGIIAEERKSRQLLLHNDKEGLEDVLWRSYGVLQNARRVNGKEALTKLSDIQLGVDLNILPQWGKDSFNELIAITRPNFLSKYAGNDNLTDIERDSYRAKVIRQKLSH
ncbi:MAG TPA: protein arginine kinase [Veillonella dispar]|uniref:protein arginine kinase n=1 Tax=Veillonella sp. TaxID=1926307 RepID=UPI000EF0A496|nr:protein arginine kinase [Veillonella sp.]MBS5765167.1 protein arginine kinase [Veillonella sp.]HCK94993.1 protein arginine kinase [Veillonella dispar]